MWRVESFQSGTVIVAKVDSNGPWYYVFGPKTIKDESEHQHWRSQHATELCEYLNSKSKLPPWIKEFKRINESRLEHQNGAAILAVGPMFDANPPALQWEERKDWDSQAARARLLDNITFKAS